MLKAFYIFGQKIKITPKSNDLFVTLDTSSNCTIKSVVITEDDHTVENVLKIKYF